MAITDADRLAAAGRELTIAGRPLHVRYTPRSLKLMEDKYGSLQKIGQLLQDMNSGDVPLISTVFYILSLGLRHEEGITEDWLLDNGDGKDLAIYADVAFTALVEALPSSATREADSEIPVDPTPATSLNASNGTRTSGWPSQSLEEAPANSGT